MKERTARWIIATLILLCGGVHSFLLYRFQAICIEMGVPLPALTQAVFAVTPAGWLALFIFVGLVVGLSDLRPSWHLGYVVLLCTTLVIAGVIVAAVILPVMEIASPSPLSTRSSQPLSASRLALAVPGR